MRKFVILGAGITGLFSAAQLEEIKEDYLIIEKDNLPGGYCKSIRQDGFVWDYAGHFFHFADKVNREYFKSVFNSENTVEKDKNTKIQYRDMYIDYPFQCNIHQLKKDEFIECLYDLYFKSKLENYTNFKEMLYAKFGKSISEKFLIPYNEKLYACDLNKLDCNAMGRFFPYASLDDIIGNFKTGYFSTYNNRFIYPAAGAQTIIDYLLKQIKTENLSLNSHIIDIDLEKKIINLDGSKIKYEHLISTIPFPVFLELSGLMNHIKSSVFSANKVLVFNMGFDKPSSVKYDWVYYPENKYNFYRIGFYNNILGTDRLSIYAEIGFNADEVINVEYEKEKTIEYLKYAGIINDHVLISSNNLIMNPAYVHISKESEEIKNQIIDNLKAYNVQFAGRYGLWTYCSMEDCFNQAKEAVLKSINE